MIYCIVGLKTKTAICLDSEILSIGIQYYFRLN